MMAQHDDRWVDTIGIDALPTGTVTRVEVGGRRICLANVGGELFALGDTCTHEEASLSAGTLWEDTCEIECPFHDSTFDLRTGWPSNPPATMPVDVYEVHVSDGRVQVRL
jgi:3-phenylpropionate/trans-cinnamate dioxygenase ferredoxin component